MVAVSGGASFGSSQHLRAPCLREHAYRAWRFQLRCACSIAPMRRLRDSRAPVIRAALMAAVVVSAIWGARPFVVACGARGMRMRFACCVSSECAVVVVFPFSCIDFGNRGALRPSYRRGLKLHLGGGQKRCARRVRLRQRRISPSRPLRRASLSRVPLMSPLANMIAAPLFTVFIAGGLVGLGLTALYAPAGKAILAAIDRLWPRRYPSSWRRLRAFPLRLFHARPDMWVVVVLSALAFPAASWVIWPRPTRARAVGVAAATALVVVACVVVAPLLQPTKSSRSMWGRAMRFW